VAVLGVKPVKQDIQFVKGDDVDLYFRLQAQVFNPSTQLYEAGDYVNLTGSEVRSQIRDDFGGALLETFTPGLADQTIYPGLLVLSLTADQTETFDPPPLVAKNTYKYDVEIILPNGKKRTYIQGSVSVLPEVTAP
jgi:hypothetical protein